MVRPSSSSSCLQTLSSLASSSRLSFPCFSFYLCFSCGVACNLPESMSTSHFSPLTLTPLSSVNPDLFSPFDRRYLPLLLLSARLPLASRRPFPSICWHERVSRAIIAWRWNSRLVYNDDDDDLLDHENRGRISIAIPDNDAQAGGERERERN